MRLRTFVIYFWSFLMFVFAGFGTFYIITGDNILTGQSRDVVIANVLPASDENTSDQGESSNTLEDQKSGNDEENKDLLLFNEVMSKTSSSYSYKLEANDTTDKSVVFFRFGEDQGNTYIAVYGSGLDIERQHFAFLVSGDSQEMLGELISVDDTDVLKLGVSKEGKLTSSTSVVIATDEEYSDSLVTHEASVDLSELYGSEFEDSAEPDADDSTEEGNETTDGGSESSVQEETEDTDTAE